MDERLREHIGATIEGGAWEPITGILWENETPWQLFKFEQDVEFEREIYRCVIIEKWVYDPDDLTAVDYAEDVFAKAWMIR